MSSATPTGNLTRWSAMLSPEQIDDAIARVRGMGFTLDVQLVVKEANEELPMNTYPLPRMYLFLAGSLSLYSLHESTSEWRPGEFLHTRADHSHGGTAGANGAVYVVGTSYGDHEKKERIKQLTMKVEKHMEEIEQLKKEIEQVEGELHDGEA